MSRVTFPTADSQPFIAELRQRVAEYFETRSLSSKANAAMVAKTVILYTVTFGSYALILTGWFAPLPMLGLAMLMGAGIAGIGFCVAHDALHDAYSRHPVVNHLLGWSFDLVGASSYLWRILHNVVHHTYTNVHGVDEDLEVSVLLRLSPHTRRRAMHRFQHWYGFFAYSLATLNWIFLKDFLYLMRRDLGPFQRRTHSARDLGIMVAWKLFYYTWSIVIPLLVLDVAWWQFLIGYVAMHLTAGAILGIVFQLAHVVEDTEQPLAGPDGRMESAWAVHQMRTTSNFAPRNRWLSWYVGGLNHQIEHHLFPKVCSIHYPAISGIVREVALRHGVPYNEHPTLRAAIRSHREMLRQLGRPPEAKAA
jgi:linoleoyl-CoA desaturase